MCAPSRAQCANGPGLKREERVRANKGQQACVGPAEACSRASMITTVGGSVAVQGASASKTRLMLLTAANKLVAIRDPCIHPSAIAWPPPPSICVSIYLGYIRNMPPACPETTTHLLHHNNVGTCQNAATILGNTLPASALVTSSLLFLISSCCADNTTSPCRHAQHPGLSQPWTRSRADASS